MISNLAESLNARLLRVCLKTSDDIKLAKTAADEAAGRGIQLVHQCHAESLFETVDGIIQTLEEIDHFAFGLVFEAANLEECRQNYGPDTIYRLRPWIRNVYLQNQRVASDGAITLNTWCHGPVSFDVIPIPQDGGICFETVFRALKTVGYDGLMTVHQSGPENQDVTAEQTAAETNRYLRDLFDSV